MSAASKTFAASSSVPALGSSLSCVRRLTLSGEVKVSTVCCDFGGGLVEGGAELGEEGVEGGFGV
jgi:hypothetical protein